MMLLKVLLSILLLHVLWLGFIEERQNLWLPKDDLKDPSAWSSPPLDLLRDIHDGLLAKYDCKDTGCPPNLSRARELVSVAVNRTVMHSSRRLALFFFRNLPGFMKPTMCGERTLPTCPTSPFNTG